MHRYTVTSPDDNLDPGEFEAADAAQVLGFVYQLGWRTADVEEDGEYLCSVHADEHDVWAISWRDRCNRYAEAPPRSYLI